MHPPLFVPFWYRFDLHNLHTKCQNFCLRRKNQFFLLGFKSTRPKNKAFSPFLGSYPPISKAFQAYDPPISKGFPSFDPCIRLLTYPSSNIREYPPGVDVYQCCCVVALRCIQDKNGRARPRFQCATHNP